MRAPPPPTTPSLALPWHWPHGPTHGHWPHGPGQGPMATGPMALAKALWPRPMATGPMAMAKANPWPRPGPWPLAPWPRPGPWPLAHGQGPTHGHWPWPTPWPLALTQAPPPPPARASILGPFEFFTDRGGCQAKCRFEPMGPIGYCRPSLGPIAKQLRCIVRGQWVPGHVQGLGRELR